MKAFLRFLFVIPLGFVAACLAAGFTLVAPILTGGGATLAMDIVFSIFTAMFIAVSVGPMAALPTLVAVILAEWFAWRSFFFWSPFGGVLGVAALNFGPTFEGAWTSSVGPLYLAAGLVGGGVYWLVAGRTSGRFAPAPSEPG